MVNLIDPVVRHATTRPDATALLGGSTSLTYGEFYDAALAYAGALRDAGIRRGDRVLLAAPSVPEFAIAYMGIQALGATVITVNTMSTAAEVGYFLSNSQASLAIGHVTLGPAVADDAAGATAIGETHQVAVEDRGEQRPTGEDVGGEGKIVERGNVGQTGLPP